MTSRAAAELQQVDLTNCEREPIRIPGSIQPHGLLLALDRDFIVRQASANAARAFGVDDVVGLSIDRLLPDLESRKLKDRIATDLVDGNPIWVGQITLAGQRMNTLVHRSGKCIIAEFDPAPAETLNNYQILQRQIRDAIRRMQHARTPLEVCQVAAEEVRAITGFERVMVYQFDERWNGKVVAEARDPQVDSYLNQHFPASDIPAQARELYRLNRTRLIADAGYKPVPLVPPDNPVTGVPIDLSFSVLRSVSPIHIEYLKNMGVAASMSVSIVRNDQLWGLIALHHRTPRHVPHEVRSACDFFAQLVALQLGAKDRDQLYDVRLRHKVINARLLERMTAAGDFVRGLMERPEDLMDLTGAEGVAISHAGQILTAGLAPEPHQVHRLVDFLASANLETYATHTLPTDLPDAEPFKDRAAGLLAVSLSEVHRTYVLWFRPEVVQTIQWAGNPNKPVEVDAAGDLRLHPRKSFNMWMETVRLQSLPWSEVEREAAHELRGAILNIVLKRAEETAELAAELQRINKELEAFTYSVSHDLRAPFRHIVGFTELLQKRAAGTLDETNQRYIRTIADSAKYAGRLVDALLSFSHMSRTSLRLQQIDTIHLVREVRDDVAAAEGAGRNIEWRIDDLPPVRADLTMLRLVWRNLLSNAVKYTRPRDKALIEVTCRPQGREWVFAIRDNGVGFDPQYVNKLFGVFQRLHRMEDFEGTGIGLANVRRIVERHGGRTWAEGEPDKGATFYFSLPRDPDPAEV